LHDNYFLFATIKNNTDNKLYIFYTLAKFKSSSNSTFSNIMTRMSNSTPSLPEASNDSLCTNVSVASTDQAASADNLAAKV